MKKAIYLLCSLLLPAAFLQAQDYLGGDLAFFEGKAGRYQAWLDAKKLGAQLKVAYIGLKKEGYELEMHLVLRTHDPDTAAALWPALEASFAASNPGTTLADALYETFYRFMEIPPAQGNVQVYVSRQGGEAGYNPCFYVWIWHENGKVMKENRLNNCRAQKFDVEVQRPPVAKATVGADAEVQKREEAEAVFEKVLSYARARYGRAQYEGRTPRVEEEEMEGSSLSFIVTDLTREVLTDERESLWCRMVQTVWGPCNDMRRERLEFAFEYQTRPGGYRLKVTLTGKFGSGAFVPRRSAYMDMEPDFEEDFLKPYVKRFQRDLKRHLEKK